MAVDQLAAIPACSVLAHRNVDQNPSVKVYLTRVQFFRVRVSRDIILQQAMEETAP